MESGGSREQQYPRSTQAGQGFPLNPNAVNSNSQLPQPKAPRLSPEELAVLEECNTESFWYRCLPLGLAFGGSASLLVKTGHLKPHPRYGSTLKALGGLFIGYVVGKLTYQGTCQQKIMDKIPHTNLAQSVRKAKGITSAFDDQPSAETAPVSGYSPGEGGGGGARGKLQDVYSSMDTSSSGIASVNVKELDDNMRPSLDREVKTTSEASTDAAQKVLTYGELRQQNRQEYQTTMATSPSSPFRQRPFPVSRPGGSPAAPSAPPDPEMLSVSSATDAPPPESPGRAFDSGRGKKKKNQYGDVWDNN